MTHSKSFGRSVSILASVTLAAMVAACDTPTNPPEPPVPTNLGLTAALTVSETQPLVGATSVSFTAGGRDANGDALGDALSYSWNFGDGSTATGATVSHVFAVAGTHTVVVAMSDGKGRNATATLTVTARSLSGNWTSQARAWDFEIQHTGDRITGRLLGFKNVRFDPAPSLSGVVTSPRSIQFDVPGRLSFVGTADEGASQMTGTLSEGSRNFGDVLDRQ